jgi:hypothetical protein
MRGKITGAASTRQAGLGILSFEFLNFKLKEKAGSAPIQNLKFKIETYFAGVVQW